MYPLTYREIGDAKRLDAMIAFGTLPLILDAGSERSELLESYTFTYLREEIQAEALVRDLGAFGRFLECAALANGQVTNLSSIARDAGVQRPTVQGYFEVLRDTLIGELLPAWRPRARIKEQAHPKFYWFDSGVARTMSGRLRGQVSGEERGVLFETYVLHELRAHLDNGRLPGTLSYWRTGSNVEVDFVWSHGKTHVGLEVKASPRWRTEYWRGLVALDEAVGLESGFGVYLGTETLKEGRFRVLPLAVFLDELYAGRIFRA